MAMYVYPSGVETPIKNMYIGQYPNIIVHFPFTDDILDHWPNQVSMTQNDGTATFTTLSSWKKVLASSNWFALQSSSNFISTYLSDHKYTVHYWVNITLNVTNRRNHFWLVQNPSAWREGVETAMCSRETNQSGYDQVYYDWIYNPVGTTRYNWWHHVAVTYDNWQVTAYVNWSVYQTWTSNNLTDWYFQISWWSSGDGIYGNMSEFYIEYWVMKQSDIAKEYNDTKSLYWIS